MATKVLNSIYKTEVTTEAIKTHCTFLQFNFFLSQVKIAQVSYIVFGSIAVRLTKLSEDTVPESEIQSYSHFMPSPTFSKQDTIPAWYLFKKQTHQLCTTGSYLNSEFIFIIQPTLQGE